MVPDHKPKHTITTSEEKIARNKTDWVKQVMPAGNLQINLQSSKILNKRAGLLSCISATRLLEFTQTLKSKSGRPT